ncbi:ASCH domain-containing protein [Streptomyces griseoaurantiacus]|uniref:ASCH domain-containing protein n=1 Tax=Streptomyces griseoaurantiacus TaxID=68213 RepID=UPI0030E1933A
MVSMQLFDSERRVIEAAERLAATLGSDSNHTVAAAAMDTAGRIHEAVNVYHFTGGPCAELVVLGVAAAAGAGPLVTMATAGDRGRGLIPPCGRCRQVLLDLRPDVLVAVLTDDGPTLQPIRKLLPDAYFFPHADARRIVRFNKRYYEAVATARKTTTIRYDDPIALGPAIFLFEDEETHRTLNGTVIGVERDRLDRLTAEQARLDGFMSVEELNKGLQGHYPGLPADAEVDVVTFTVEAPDAGSDTQS